MPNDCRTHSTVDLVRSCAQSERLMRRLKGKPGRADVRAVSNLADPLAGSARAQRCAPGSRQPILPCPDLRRDVARRCHQQQDRPRRPCSSVASASALTQRAQRWGPMTGRWSGRDDSGGYSRRSPGSSGAEVEVRLVRMPACAFALVNGGHGRTWRDTGGCEPLTTPWKRTDSRMPRRDTPASPSARSAGLCRCWQS